MYPGNCIPLTDTQTALLPLVCHPNIGTWLRHIFRKTAIPFHYYSIRFITVYTGFFTTKDSEVVVLLLVRAAHVRTHEIFHVIRSLPGVGSLLPIHNIQEHGLDWRAQDSYSPGAGDCKFWRGPHF